MPRKESSLPSIREHSNARPVRVTSDDQHLLAVTSGSRAASQWSATTEDMMNRYGVRWLERILASSNELIARRDREALLTAQGQRQNLAPKSSAPPEIGSSSPESEIAEVLPEASEKRFEGLIADLERLLNEALIMARAAEERDPTDLDPQVTSTAPHVTYEEPEGLDSGFREFGKLTGERLATPWAQDMRTHRDPVRQQPARHQIEPLQAPVVKSTGLSRRTPRTQSLQVDTQTDPLAVTLSKDQIPLGTSRVDYATATGSDSPGKLTANDQYLEPARPMASELPRRSTEDHVVRNGKPQIEARGREAVEEQIELYHSSPMGPPTGHHQVKTIKPWEAKARAVALGRDYNGDTTIVYAVPEGAEPPEHSLAQSTSPPPTVKHENIPMTRMRESQYDRSSSTFRAGLGLSGRRHISLRGETPGFNLYRTSKQQPIARDWGRIRKHMVSIMACMGTSLIGLLIGIYAGEVPAIQYQIVDYNHNTLQGNVWLYMGMACSTLLFWPLSLLHGRKPYILLGLVLLIPLQFVQGLIVSQQRSPYDTRWRYGLL